jgi:hypothetical protein
LSYKIWDITGVYYYFVISGIFPNLENDLEDYPVAPQYLLNL